MPSLRLGEGGLLLLLGTLVAFGPLSIDLYLPALPAIARGLAASAETVQLSVTVFLAGFSAGMLFYGPISDRFGRRRIVLSGIALFVLATLACAFANSATSLIAARFLQALGGGAASVLARAVARDVYPPVEALRKLSQMAMVTAIAPLLAPVIGSGVLLFGGWRATFGVLLAWGAICLVATWTCLPETLPPERRGTLKIGQAFAAYGQILTNPGALGLILAGGGSFAAMFAYITAGPFYFIELNRLKPYQYSLIFALNAIGIFCANYANSRWVRTQGARRLAGAGCALGLLAALCLPFLVAQHNLAAVIGALFFVVSVTGLLGANCVGLLMHGFPRNAGAAAALFGTGQFGLGMLASWAVSHTHDGTGMPMAWVMLGASATAALGFTLHCMLADQRFAPHPETRA
ncbi:MAG: multidrug effflux MFS transporter [Betaproteobacteria bacterium]|nr:multidrug effflux MFS transporter [Betaproteobacteria bacterium]